MNPVQYLILLFIITFIGSCKSQTLESIIADPVLEKVKETSLYADNVNWNKVEKKYLELIKDKSSIAEMKPAFEYLLNSIGDKHAVIRSPKDFSTIAYYTGPKEPDHRDSKFVSEVINDVSSEFTYKLLQSNIGYLKVVGIAPQNIPENAQKIRNGVLDLHQQGAKKWILDLRYNGGGDVNPMLAGLAPLLGDGNIGGSVDKNEEMHREYVIRNNEFYDTGNLMDSTGHNPSSISKDKVAVLLSRYTISSGEMTAVAFKGRENTIFIGETTAGYTTGNGWDQISEEILLNISQSVFVDRNKNIYYDNVGVDIEIEFQPGLELVKDPYISGAIEWFSL